MGDDAEAVVLEFVEPALADRHLGGEDRLARDDEAGRQMALRPGPADRGAHQHGGAFSAERPPKSLRQVGAPPAHSFREPYASQRTAAEADQDEGIETEPCRWPRLERGGLRARARPDRMSWAAPKTRRRRPSLSFGPRSPTRTNERPGQSPPTLRASPSTSRRVTKNSPPRPKLGGLRLRYEGLPPMANAGGRRAKWPAISSGQRRWCDLIMLAWPGPAVRLRGFCDQCSSLRPWLPELRRLARRCRLRLTWPESFRTRPSAKAR